VNLIIPEPIDNIIPEIKADLVRQCVVVALPDLVVLRVSRWTVLAAD
jgi:hypothetical protein